MLQTSYDKFIHAFQEIAPLISHGTRLTTVVKAILQIYGFIELANIRFMKHFQNWLVVIYIDARYIAKCYSRCSLLSRHQQMEERENVFQGELNNVRASSLNTKPEIDDQYYHSKTALDC